MDALIVELRAEERQQFERLTALLDECEAQLKRLAEWAAPNPAITESRGIALAVLLEARDIVRELGADE